MSSLEATRLQRVLSPSFLLFCINTFVLMFPWERQLLPSLFPGRESDSTKCERQEKAHFPPKAVSASCQDLIAASYKTLIWRSKWSRITSLQFSSAALTLRMHSKELAVRQQRGLHSSHTLVRLQAGKRWIGKTNSRTMDLASPPAFLLRTTDKAARNRQAACLDSSYVF